MSAVGNKSGQAICVRGTEFPQSPQAIQMKIKGKGSIEIHMDSPDGPLLSTLTFDTDTWQTLTKPLDKRIKGKHDIYFVFGNGKFLFDEWKFTK
jgi:arabinoxylan arabinofuranohydrolase